VEVAEDQVNVGTLGQVDCPGLPIALDLQAEHPVYSSLPRLVTSMCLCRPALNASMRWTLLAVIVQSSICMEMTVISLLSLLVL